MVSSRAITVAQYLAELPPERRAVISAIRDLINKNMPPGYVESMNWGMISWEIPLSRYPVTYNGQPLSYMALAAQKNNYALYSMGVYGNPALDAWLHEEFRRAGLKLDMGKSCIRFKSLDGIPRTAIAGLASATTVEEYIARYDAMRSGRPMPSSKPAPRKTARPIAPVKQVVVKQAARLTAKKAVPARKATARDASKRPARAKAEPSARRAAKRAKRK